MQTALATSPETMSPTTSPTMSPMAAEPDVRLAASGDRHAFERLYRDNLNHVYAVCVRMCGDRMRAEELAQDAFVRAWERLPQFRGDSAFSTWLHRLTVNVVLEAQRSERRNRARTESDDVLDEAPPITRREHHAEKMDLAVAIAALPPGARAVFALHDVEGYKHEEIAEMLDITAGGSKAQLHRARRLLREALA
ncbi:MAG TPA: RNA polymerase sigma factor [Gemmatimonadaceae bacterium]|nr:RNA polymerase sigma factor [Gemmatimonadaceae bacterium]